VTTESLNTYIARLHEADQRSRADAAPLTDYKSIPDLGEPNDLTELPPRSEPLLSEYPPDDPGELTCPYCARFGYAVGCTHPDHNSPRGAP
jgi:hypothetical protein